MLGKCQFGFRIKMQLLGPAEELPNDVHSFWFWLPGPCCPALLWCLPGLSDGIVASTSSAPSDSPVHMQAQRSAASSPALPSRFWFLCPQPFTGRSSSASFCAFSESFLSHKEWRICFRASCLVHFAMYALDLPKPSSRVFVLAEINHSSPDSRLFLFWLLGSGVKQEPATK